MPSLQIMKFDSFIRHIVIGTKTAVFHGKELAKEYRELVSYVFFGVLTTGVDFGVYTILSKLFSVDPTVSNIIAWLCAVIFAFVTNKLYVFRARSGGAGRLFYEFYTFFAARAVTGIIYTAGFNIMVSQLGVNDYLSKIFLSVFNIVANYVFSKLVTFKKGSNGKKDKEASDEGFAPMVKDGMIIIGNGDGTDEVENNADTAKIGEKDNET